MCMRLLYILYMRCTVRFRISFLFPCSSLHFSIPFCVPPWQGQDPWLNKQYEDDPDISKEVSFVQAPSHKDTHNQHVKLKECKEAKYCHKITICMSILPEFFYFKNSTTPPQSVTPTDLIACAFVDQRQDSGGRLLQNLAESSWRQDQGGWRCMGKFWKVFSISLWLD